MVASATLLAAVPLSLTQAQTPRPIPADIAAVGAPVAAVPPAALSRRADFRLKLYLSGRPARTSRVRDYQIDATNSARWRASSVRVCARVSGASARIAGVKAPGSRRTSTSACWLLRSLAAGKHRLLGLRVRTPRPLLRPRRAIVRITASAGNSNRLSRVFSTASAVHRRVAAVKRSAQPRGSQAAERRTAAVRAAADPRSTTCLGGQQLAIAFVADDSGSMAESDPDELRGRAISVGLDQLPDGSVAGATSFDNVSRVLFAPSAVTPSSRPSLKAAADALSASGDTHYQDAFDGAKAQLDAMPATDRKAVVFLSDGAPTDEDFDSDRPIAAAGVPIFTIGFGDADKAILADIAARSGGQTFNAASAGELQSIFAHVGAILTCAAASVATKVQLAPGTVQVVPFGVGLNDGEFRALASWSGGDVTVSAVRPSGSEMTPSALLAGEAFSNNPTYALLTGTNPAVGAWSLRIVAPAANADTVSVSIDVFDKGLTPLPAQPPLDVAKEGRRRDPCLPAFPGGKQQTKKVFGGTQTNYDRAASLFDVCAGFGAPEDLQLTLSQKCAMITATAIAVGGHAGPLAGLDTLCGGADTLNELASGNWAGAAGSRACEYFGVVLGTGLGIAAAGAAAETGPGAVLIGTVTYRAVASGAALICGGVTIQSLQALGSKIESDHERDIARDIASRGKCLRSTTRFRLISWSAADCSV